MLKKIGYILLLSILAAKAEAQSYYTSSEYGVCVGGSQYFGDLNERWGFKTISPAYGAYVRKHLNYYIALKGCINYTNVGYDDKYNDAPYSKQRNLNFKSNIFEVTAQAEFNFFKFITGDYSHRLTPYLTGGLGVFYYNPYTEYKGVKYYLREMGTEGQNAGYDNRKYSNFSMCVPIGGGIKFWLRPGINLSIEIADRLTFTDYLDDVSTTYVGASKFPKISVANPSLALQDRSGELNSGDQLGRAGKQRGNPSSKDQYLMAIFSLSWHFTTYKCPAFMDHDLIRVY